MHESPHEPNLEQLARARMNDPRIVRTLSLTAIIGAMLTAVGCLLVEHPWQRFWGAYLLAFTFVLTISLGALFFVIVQHVTRASWSVVIRRPAEILALNLATVALLFLPIAWTVWRHDGVIYSWAAESAVVTGDEQRHASDTRPVAFAAHAPPSHDGDLDVHATGANDHGGHSEHLLSKPYLTPHRYLGSWLVYFGIWIGLGVFYFRHSIAQDRHADIGGTRRMEWLAGISAVLFGLAVTYAAFDLLMSLAPAWYSTIFGVYFFAGCAVSGLALLLILFLGLRRLTVAKQVLTDEVQRDLGRLLFAFVFFWGYIAFSQYMLLWYANVPETTFWLVRRGMSTAREYANSWGWLSLALLFGHFLIPFVGIMSRHVKSNSAAMTFWAIWLLAVHYLDLYWIIIPHWHSQLTVSLVEPAVAVALFAVFLLTAHWIASRYPLFPVGDPRFSESLHREAMY